MIQQNNTSFQALCTWKHFCFMIIVLWLGSWYRNVVLIRRYRTSVDPAINYSTSNPSLTINNFQCTLKLNVCLSLRLEIKTHIDYVPFLPFPVETKLFTRENDDRNSVPVCLTLSGMASHLIKPTPLDTA